MQVEIYKFSQKKIWDQFVENSKNGTFLFFRDYMDYHSDRFQDYSLMIKNDKAKLIAILPANSSNDNIISHEGLTYGGFIVDKKMKTPIMLDLFESVLEFLKKHGFKSLVYKTVPHIYHKLPAEEDLYALFLCNAKLLRRDVMSVIDSRFPLKFQEQRRRGLQKARKYGFYVKQSDDFKNYWDILSNNLSKKHSKEPVHSLEEIILLHNRFPGNIKLFACFQDSLMLAGAVVYESQNAVHIQYISSSEQGQTSGALDLTFNYLINEIYPDKYYFDFGISNESDGWYLNKGLVDQKEGFGARTIVHSHYNVDLMSWSKGQIWNVLTK
ncbi:MAG: GNAT family N-acetyltransferase [Thermodesulfobacteriota bacterium]|nr:GNAT family N-acetyltransferase [Thermodesulfobacteriota bacterium]